jgi:hypothetical protein
MQNTRSAQPTSEIQIALRVLERLDCPRALTVSILLRYECYDDIVTLQTAPLDYSSRSDFFRAYQATRLLQKSRWLPTTFNKRKVALDTFWAAEAKCKETNDFFRSVSNHAASFADHDVRATILAAKRKIRDVLRRFRPSQSLDHCGFGPGADLSTRRGFTSAYNKLATRGTVTRECSGLVDFLASHSALSRLFTWDISTKSISIDRVPGNRVAFVPKDCKTDRTIAVEPRWNIFLQKGIGFVLRRALKYAGCDLDSQSRNQLLAKEGSIDGSYATLDLQSASDSVSSELVRFLLPPDWVTMLSRTRSRSFLLDGEWRLAEKWSSMGNGYTFELESLIFYAICSAVCGEREFSVYGDDLVVPTDLQAKIVNTLKVCGFTLNMKKSYTTGPFRESCGADYFFGSLVTPIYWKENLNDEGTLRLVNQISVLAARFGDSHFRDRRFRAVWKDLVHRLPPRYRFLGPNHISTVIHSPSGEWAKVSKWGWDGWFIRAWLPHSVRFRYYEYDPAVLSQFFSPSSDGYSIRDRIRWKRGTVFIPSGFEDLGEWM